MADNIRKAAGQGGDKEEEPIIVAQRFLNIFHQLHVFDEEKREVFNKMILEQPPQVRNIFRQLPGGSVLLEYIDEIEGKEGVSSEDIEEVENEISPVSNVTQAPQSIPSSVSANNKTEVFFDSDAFAKILANTLAQSNAQIIKELQKNTQLLANRSSSTDQPSQLTLVTDDSFTQSIADALIKAISTSEQKRQEDTKIIANSFLELQENLSKMIEKNAQLKIVADGKVSDKTASAFQFKDIVDDLVKSQTKFLKETSQSQKEELASIVSSAIKESIKLSTQSLADTFRQLYNEPTPITYASPEQKKQDISEIENIIKAQGREFSSIIAAALRESQKNSTQSIIKTIEGLKPAASDSTLQKADEIVKSQTQLLRDITKEQNKEFSQMIANALKEGQKQANQTIVELFKNMQANGFVNRGATFYPNNFYPQIAENVETASAEEVPVEQKKKKKKKKNKTAPESYALQHDVSTDFSKYDTSPSADVGDFDTTEQTAPVSDAEDWGFSTSDNNVYNKAENEPVLLSDDVEESDVNATNDLDIADKDESTDYSFEDVSSEEISGEEGKDWEWEYEEVDDNGDDQWNAAEITEGEEGKDWEWEYEEVEDGAENTDNTVIEESQIVIPDDFKMLLIGLDPDKIEDPYCENVDDVY